MVFCGFILDWAKRTLSSTLVLLTIVALSGCGEEVVPEEELVLTSEKNDWVEIDLGTFTIAVLIADDPTRQPNYDTYQESVALHYQLHCLVAEGKEEQFREFLENKRGELSDEVIKTCRHANLIDLADPELQLIRSQLRDFSEEFVGRGVVKRFVFSNVVLERY